MDSGCANPRSSTLSAGTPGPYPDWEYRITRYGTSNSHFLKLFGLSEFLDDFTPRSSILRVAARHCPPGLPARTRTGSIESRQSEHQISVAQTRSSFEQWIQDVPSGAARHRRPGLPVRTRTGSIELRVTAHPKLPSSNIPLFEPAA